MIVIDLTIAIAAFFSFCFILVFGVWVVYNSSDKGGGSAHDNVIQCPYCAHIFTENDPTLLRCPFCKSLIDPDEHRIA